MSKSRHSRSFAQAAQTGRMTALKSEMCVRLTWKVTKSVTCGDGDMALAMIAVVLAVGADVVVRILV